jgi:hypothetical protein
LVYGSAKNANLTTMCTPNRATTTVVTVFNMHPSVHPIARPVTPSGLSRIGVLASSPSSARATGAQPHRDRHSGGQFVHMPSSAPRDGLPPGVLCRAVDGGLGVEKAPLSSV